MARVVLSVVVVCGVSNRALCLKTEGGREMHNSAEPGQEKLLIYSPNGNGFAKGLAQAELVNSPLRFLDEAVDEAFTRFVVMADEQAAARADELIELCATLRHNSHTRATPLICILKSEQEGLATELNQVGVRHIWVTGADSPAIGDQLAHLDQKFLHRIERHTGPKEGPCPYITYDHISERQEIMYCGAYRNRLVLGRYLLNNYCQGPAFMDCEYFKSPKSVE